MSNQQIVAGKRLIISDAITGISLDEVLVCEVSKSGKLAKLRNLISDQEYWEKTCDFNVVEELAPLSVGEPVKPYKSPTVADLEFGMTHVHSNPDDSIVYHATNKSA